MGAGAGVVGEVVEESVRGSGGDREEVAVGAWLSGWAGYVGCGQAVR